MIWKDTYFFQNKCEALKEWMALWIENRFTQNQSQTIYWETGMMFFPATFTLLPFEEWWRRHPRYIQWARREVDWAVRPLRSKLEALLTLLPPVPMKMQGDMFVPLSTEVSPDIKALQDMIAYYGKMMYQQMGINVTRN